MLVITFVRGNSTVVCKVTPYFEIHSSFKLKDMLQPLRYIHIITLPPGINEVSNIKHINMKRHCITYGEIVWSPTGKMLWCKMGLHVILQ